jgi:DnaJ-class molecular chaperone
MKLPLHHGIRTNKSVRKSWVLQKDRTLLSTRYENCPKCNGSGEVYYKGSSKSILSHVTCHGEKVFTDQLCKHCDEVSRKYCKNCDSIGYTDFIECNACFGSGLNDKTKSYQVKLFRSDNRRKIKKEKPGYMRCYDCSARICDHVVWDREKMHKLVKTTNYDIFSYYNDLYE